MAQGICDGINNCEQKSLEMYLKDHKINDPDKIARILPEITQMIYKRNINVAKMEKEEDAYKKKQLLESVNEYDQAIEETFNDFK